MATVYSLLCWGGYNGSAREVTNDSPVGALKLWSSDLKRIPGCNPSALRSCSSKSHHSQMTVWFHLH